MNLLGLILVFHQVNALRKDENCSKLSFLMYFEKKRHDYSVLQPEKKCKWNNLQINIPVKAIHLLKIRRI